MFGEGISILDLTLLVKSIREKNLVLQVKILQQPWEDFSPVSLQEMIRAITRGDVSDSGDIRLRLFDRRAKTIP